MGNIYSDLVEERSQWDPIPMEDLIELNNEWKHTHITKNLGILAGTSGIISIISSSTLIWMILRSHQGLSTTQHRLLLGLCVCDIILSLGCSTFNTAAPSEMNYRIWNARGNQATCDVQGFLAFLGATGGLYYNAALNLYFLAVVKYEKSAEYIRTKIEPFLHAVPILVSLTISISLLIGKHTNSDGKLWALCSDTIYFPQHCEGYDAGETRPGFDIPCGRGLEGAMTDAVSRVVFMSIPIIIIFISLGIIYRVVRTQEKKLARYASFRTNLQQSILLVRRNTQTPKEDSKNSHRLLRSIRRSLSQSWTTLVSSYTITATASSIRSNDTKSKSRAVMHKAFGYSFAWFLSHGAIVAGDVIFFTGSNIPVAIPYIIVIFVPLQGFFNLAIYMLPKVVYAKKQGQGENVSICQAIRKAFWSKGSARTTGSGTNGRHSRKGGWSINLRAGDNRQTSSPHPRPLRRSNNTTDTSARHLSSAIQHLRMPRKERQEEEEKCEIQAPQSMMPPKKRTSLVTFAPNEAVHVPTIKDDINDGDDVNTPIRSPQTQSSIGHVAIENNITSPGRGGSLGTGQLISDADDADIAI